MESPEGRVLTFDLEAVGLLFDIRKGHREDLHVIHLKDMETGELFTFFDDFDDRINAVWLDEFENGYKQGDIADGVRWMERCKILISHNISGFDAIAVEKAVGFKRNHFQAINHPIFPFATCDTLTMSYVLNPERKVPFAAYGLGKGNIGAHGIAAYGILMDNFKPDHDDWSHLSKEMLHRVEEDVEIGEFTFEYLMKEWDEQMQRPSKVTGKSIREAYWCELRMAFAVARQAQRGFALDVAFISELVPELDEQIIGTEQGFRPHMPLRLKKKKIPEAQVEKNGACVMAFGVSPSSYENYMLNGDCRASHAATNWSITKKNGEYSKNVTKYVPAARGFMQDHAVPPVAGPFTPLVWEEIPLGNRDAVKQILFRYGWKGVNYNDTELEYIEDNGELPKPWAGKIDDDSLEIWEESEHIVPDWCKGIARWYVLQSRRTQLLNAKDQAYYDLNGLWPRQASKKNECRGLLPKSRCYDKGSCCEGKTAQEYYEKNGAWPTSGHWRVPAEAFSCATNTFRMRHKVVVNIPSRGLYGKEMRRCFIASPGNVLLGVDGSGLELRMLANFMNDEEYTYIVLNGDIHTYNQEKAGLATRDMAKKYIYMYLYGAGIPNLAKQIGMTEQEMAACVAKFSRDLPALSDLSERVQAAASKFGYLLSVDGRWGRVRVRNKKIALNTALNVLLQMTGSLVMKWAHCIAEDMAVEAGLIDDVADFPIVAHVHDECQMDVAPDEAEAYGKIYCDALRLAGEELKLKCATAGEALIGASWSETH